MNLNLLSLILFMNFSCSNCLELSSLCGWCIYGNQCASKASVCTESSHWIKVDTIFFLFINSCKACFSIIQGVNETSSDPALTCPHVLLPSNRLYKIQAATQLSLDTDHLPEQVVIFETWDCNHYSHTPLDRRLFIQVWNDSSRPSNCSNSECSLY